MLFAPIVPFEYMDTLGRGQIHLLLAQHGALPGYRAHYKDRRLAGEYIIVDNGAFELGSSMPWKDVLNFAQWLHAQEVVLPDVMFDSVATQTAAVEALKTLPADMHVMIVPQGSTFREWEMCLHNMVHTFAHMRPHDSIPTIGVSKVYEKKIQGGRYRLLECMEQIRQSGVILQVHLLGMTTPMSLSVLQARFPWIRSVDSAKPVTAALHDIVYPESRALQTTESVVPKRSRYFFTQKMNERTLWNARDNIAFCTQVAQGRLRLH